MGRKRAASPRADVEEEGHMEGRASTVLRKEEMDKLVGLVMRHILAKHLSKQMVARNDISKLFDESVRQKRLGADVFKVAQRNFKDLLGMEIVEVQKRVKARGNTGMSQAARSVLSQSGASQASGGSKYYILVSSLPDEMRPPPEDKSIVGLILVVANIILLDVQYRVEEEALFARLETLGVKRKGDRSYSHPQIQNVTQLLEVDFPRQGYFDRERDGQSFYYTLGPRLRGEIESEDLVNIVQEVYGNDMDDTTRKELLLRLDGIPEDDGDN